MSLKTENIIESNSTTENSFEEIDLDLSTKKDNKLNNFDFLKSKNISEDQYLLNINRVIEDLITESQENQKSNKLKINNNISIFHMKNLPKISFRNYLLRINQYLKPEKSTILLALMYIDDLYSNSNSNLFISWNNIFKIFLTAIIIAIKFNEDQYDSNNVFAKVGGIGLDELNKLEIEFCKIMKFSFFVDLKSFNEYKILLENF